LVGTLSLYEDAIRRGRPYVYPTILMVQLFIIRISLENLKLLYGVDARKQKQFDKVDRSIDRIIHQVDDVLGFVREIPIKLEKTTLSEIIHESLDSITIPDNIKLYESRFTHKSIQLHKKI